MKIDLKEKRTKLKLTQEDVAKKVGITRPYYTLIEAGERQPSPYIAQKIAEIYGFDWALFFTQ